MKEKKKRLFRVEIKRVQVTIYSVLYEAPSPADAVRDVKEGRNTIQKYFAPIYTDDQTTLKSIREVKRRK